MCEFLQARNLEARRLYASRLATEAEKPVRLRHLCDWCRRWSTSFSTMSSIDIAFVLPK